jgi:hypothetical protein
LLKSNSASAATVIFSPAGFGPPAAAPGQQAWELRRVANFSRDQVLVALATSRILGGSGRGPVAGTPAQAETALGDDITLVDYINAFLSLGDGGTKANASQKSQNQRFLGDIFDHCFPSLKKISKLLTRASVCSTHSPADFQSILP